MSDNEGGPGPSPRLVQMMERATSDWSYRRWAIGVGVILGLWVWEAPSTRRLIASVAFLAAFLVLSYLSKRVDRHALSQVKASESKRPMSTGQKVLAWIVLAVAIGIGLWMGVQSILNDLPN